MSTLKNKERVSISIADLKEAILHIAKKNKSKEKKLITVREIQTYFIMEKNKKPSAQTIRNNGFIHGGYFEKAYPRACSYNHKGNTNYRGLIIKPQKIIQELEK